MYYETKSFQELLEIMASCDRLGFFYVVQKDVSKKKKVGFWSKTVEEPIYKLQIIQYLEEGEEVEETVSYRGQSESEEDDS